MVKRREGFDKSIPGLETVIAQQKEMLEKIALENKSKSNKEKKNLAPIKKRLKQLEGRLSGIKKEIKEYEQYKKNNELEKEKKTI
ncbi:MAG: hypothetical protein HRU35_02905 [Rickettsiaceae bacterium]|nr:hypothetical protein [Rickettsiaceae bacterium]